MSTVAQPRRRTSRRGRAAVRRRRVLALVGLLALLVAGFNLLLPSIDRTVTQVTLPLQYEDIIRQQARDKGVDPALIAAVIYAESRFRDATSPAGARGLMQITPATAEVIARRSGGTRFVQGDLATPQINIAYGTYHLRWLLDRYHGDVPLAVAAYNAGEGNVDHWRREGRARRDAIPFPETREYVRRVLDARARYRLEYAAELGL
jgi:soluble lytic murein transglycosylase